MYKGYQVVCCVPSGRKNNLDILLPYLLRQKHVVDEIRLWQNTSNDTDLQCIREWSINYPDKIRVEYIPDCFAGLTFKNYQNCCDMHTIYFKIDDDICWIAEGALELMMDVLITQRPFIVSSNCVNTYATCSIFEAQQLLGHQLPSGMLVKEAARQDVSHLIANTELAEHIHYCFLHKLKQQQEHHFLFRATIKAFVPLNMIAWFGRDFAIFDGKVLGHDEVQLNHYHMNQVQKNNALVGEALSVHYSYHPTRAYLDRTSILQCYADIVKNWRSDHQL